MSPDTAGSGALAALLVDRMLAARHEIDERLAAAGAAPGAVTVVAVSKTHSAASARAAALAGFGELGESYANELAAKAPELADLATPPRWHFIGQLQTNKVRVVAPYVSLYQSVDRPSLVAELAKRVPGASILVQVDLAGTPGRGGIAFDDAPALIESARAAGLDVRGVMGVAPQADDRVVAASFHRLRALRDSEGLVECSMGMSGDLELAVAEGSTMVRIGSSIFGERR